MDDTWEYVGVPWGTGDYKGLHGGGGGYTRLQRDTWE